MKVREKNPGVKLDIDAEILSVFSQQYRDRSGLLKGVEGGELGEGLNRIYAFYDNFLNNLGGTSLSWEQQLIYTAALEERLFVSSLVDEANLQIKKAQSISDKRGDAFRMVRQAVVEMRGKFEKMEKELRSSKTSESRVNLLLEEFRGTLNSSFASFESVGGVEPMLALAERKVHDGARYSGAVSGAEVEFAVSEGFIPNW